MPRYSQIPAFVLVQQDVAAALAAPTMPPSGDLVAMAAILRSLEWRRISPRTLEKLHTLHEDVAAAAFEHAEAMGKISSRESARRSASTMEQFLRRTPPAGDVLGAVLRQAYFAIEYAQIQCAMHLPRQQPRTVRHRRVGRHGGGRRARA